MAVILKHRAISVMIMLAILAAGGFTLFSRANSSKAASDSSKWKTFKEDAYGFLVGYPGSWSLDVSYDRYAPGLMNADLTNKKCGFNPKECAVDCVDMRILVGKKPESGSAPGLLGQLYEDFMMVRDFSTASLISTLDMAPKKVFEVASDAPTQSMTGSCGGPLYVFETDTDFVYVFAGYGSDAATNAATVEKIISSIEIK